MVILAVIGTVISLFALLLSFQANREAAKVHLDAVASINSLGSTPAGYAVRVSFVNDSLRPVIVRSMKLEISGKPVAPITSFLTDNRAAADASALGDEPIDEARSLPFALGERGARTLIGLANFSIADSQAHRGEETPLLARARQFCRELQRPSSWRNPSEKVDRAPSTIQLEVDYDPGDTLTVPVHLASPLGGANSWRMEVTGARSRPDGIAFWRRVAAPSALRLIALKIWTWNGRLQRSMSLPVVGAAYGEMQFPPLQAGSYRAALFENDEPLAVGLFHVPLDGTKEIIYPRHAQRANGECLRIEGKHNIFNYARKLYVHSGH